MYIYLYNYLMKCLFFFIADSHLATQEFVYVESSVLKSLGAAIYQNFTRAARRERITLRFSMVTREVTLFPLRRVAEARNFQTPGGCVSCNGEVRMTQREEHEPNTASLTSGLEESRPTACIYAFNACNIQAYCAYITLHVA